MKLIETLTKTETINMLNGNSVGIFPTMILSDDAFYEIINDLCLGYYTNRSGEKTISSTYEKIIYLASDPDINDTPEQIIGRLIRGKFLDKWNRVYDALIFQQYNVLDNEDYTETKTGNNTDTNTYNTVKAKNGTNTDTTTYDTNVEDNGETGTKETITRSSTDNSSTYGFNSISSVPESEGMDNSTETTVGDANDNTSHNVQTKTGTESKEFGIDESETHTGTDSKKMNINESVSKHGRDRSGSRMIEDELNLRNKQIFFDIIYADIDSVATLQIYI